jgi:serine/threonine-protein kinase RsbW
VARLAVRHAAASVGRARRRLVEDLARLGLPDALVDDAALVLSEMIGNAVRFADPLPGNVLLVGWGFVNGRLLLRVTDGGGRDRPRVRDAGPFDTRGRGLAIVEAISAAWGVKRGRSGLGWSTTVWAALPAGQAMWHPAGASTAESWTPGFVISRHRRAGRATR